MPLFNRAAKMQPMRLVLFDAFDTLITPRLPIHVQYAEEAHKAGLTGVDPNNLRRVFKEAFKTVESRHPGYGRDTHPNMTPRDWWTLLIEECMKRAGVEERDLKAAMPSLGPSLLHRFESKEGYREFDDVKPVLQELKKMGIKTSVVSNADDRILTTLGSLDVLPLLTAPPILSVECGIEKPDARIYQLACKRAGIQWSEGENEGDGGIIMVGDELEADYTGPLKAGIGARLLRRPGEWSDGAKRRTEDEEHLVKQGVKIIRGLSELIDEAKSRQAGR